MLNTTPARFAVTGATRAIARKSAEIAATNAPCTALNRRENATTANAKSGPREQDIRRIRQDYDPAKYLLAGLFSGALAYAAFVGALRLWILYFGSGK